MTKTMIRLDDSYREEGYAYYLRSIEALENAASNSHVALYKATEDFQRMAKEEREAKRQEVLRKNPGSGRIKFSNRILSISQSEKGVRMRWYEVWRTSVAASPGGKSDPRFNPIKSAAGKVSRAELLRGAHEEEKEILLRHNQQAIALREAWDRLAELRRSIKKMRVHSQSAGSLIGDAQDG